MVSISGDTKVWVSLMKNLDPYLSACLLLLYPMFQSSQRRQPIRLLLSKYLWCVSFRPWYPWQYPWIDLLLPMRETPDFHLLLTVVTYISITCLWNWYSSRKHYLHTPSLYLCVYYTCYNTHKLLSSSHISCLLASLLQMRCKVNILNSNNPNLVRRGIGYGPGVWCLHLVLDQVGSPHSFPSEVVLLFCII